MNPLNLIPQYFGVVGIVLTLVSYVVNQQRALRRDPGGPTASIRARTIRRGFAIGMSVPWLVMSIGQLSGSVSGGVAYFRPRELNPYVWAWYASTFAVSLVYAYWVLFKDGANDIRTYQPFGADAGRRGAMSSVSSLKFFAALNPIWIAAWVIGLTCLSR